LLRRVLVGGVVLAVVALAAAVAAVAHPQAPGRSAPPVARADAAPVPERSHPQVVEPQAGVVARDGAVSPTGDSRPVGDAEIRRELSQLKELAAKDELAVGSRARVLRDGRAVAPQAAPQIVRDVIRTANVIAKTPYLWGGGHGSWSAVGYDCSGSVSFALAGAGLLDAPLTSGELANWAPPAPDAGSRSTPTTATSSWRSPACASTPERYPVRARAGRRPDVTRAPSPPATRAGFRAPNKMGLLSCRE